MKTFTTTIFLTLLGPLLSNAGLVFEEERVVHEANFEESEYTGTFAFTNKGDKPIKILEVNSSCGCTTALPSKQVFQPGESGEISATFDYGEREGKQIKSIRVETDQDGGDARIFLTLEVNIPSAMEYNPSVVMWNRARETELKPKEVIIESKMEEPIEILDIVASSDFFSHEIKVLEEGKKFALSIAPENIPVDHKGILRGTFVVKTSFANPLKGTLKVYAIVR